MCGRAQSDSDVLSHGNVYTYGTAFSADGSLVQAIQQRGVSMTLLCDEELASFTFPKGSILLVDGSKPIPPESRHALYRLRRENGQLFVFGKQAFNYAPSPHNAVLLANLSDSSQYSITRPVRRIKAASYENPAIETTVTDQGTIGLSFRTERRGMPDILVHFTPGDKATSSRSVLSLRARGNVYMDLLSVEITDRMGKKWFSFIPITQQWQDYFVSLADFIPEGWNKANECYPLLLPANVRNIALGTNMLTVWREQPMEFAISDVALAEDTSGYYTPTSHNRSLRLPFKENNMCIPEWLLDERGSQYYEFPGSAAGTDNNKAYDHAAERMIRTLELRPNATIQIAGDGSFRGSAFSVFPRSLAVMQADPEWTASLVHFILNTARRPRITAVLPDITQSRAGSRQFALHVTVHNFQEQTVKGKLEVDIGTSLFAVQEDLILSPNTSRTVLLECPTINPSFPFTNFSWDVRFKTDNFTDVLSDSVNVERALLHSFIYMRDVQRQYGDGRFSHHYFGDAYGARAQLAYLAYLRDHPDSKQKNEDLWQEISESDIWHSGTWFFDMLVAKQDADGGLPMGYSEHTGGRNVADGGQMALSVAQSLQYVIDTAKARAYRLLCSQFFNWAEVFYIDEVKAADLALSHPESAAKGHTNAGQYGLGRSRRRINPAGPLWVLSDILAFQLLWARISGESEVRCIAQRNKAYYIARRHSAHGYYQAEALCWAWLDNSDHDLQSDIAALLRETYVPALLEGGPRDMYRLGGRNTLKALPLLYYRRHIGDDPALRAVLLKYIWSYASECAPGSIKQLMRQFPKPVHGESLMAIKYASLSALWAMELLQPSSTLHSALFHDRSDNLVIQD